MSIWNYSPVRCSIGSVRDKEVDPVDNDQNVSTNSDQQRFREHLENATAIVRTWPQWKQALLGFPKPAAEASPSEGGARKVRRPTKAYHANPWIDFGKLLSPNRRRLLLLLPRCRNLPDHPQVNPKRKRGRLSYPSEAH